MIEHQDCELPQPGSPRGFGLVFAAVFSIIWIYHVWTGAGSSWWPLAGAVVFAALALFAPSVLAPLNHIWFRFGLLLGKVISPIIMGLIFLVAVMPTGAVMRLLGRDLLSLQRRPSAKSYWRERTKEMTSEQSMRNQF